MHYTSRLLLFLSLFSVAATKLQLTGEPLPEYVYSSEYNTSKAENRTLLKLFVSIYYHGRYNAGPISPVSITVALDQLRKDHNWLPNYEIAYRLADDECSEALQFSRITARLADMGSWKGFLPLVALGECGTFAQTISALALKPNNILGTSLYTLDPRMYITRSKFKNFFPLGPRGDYYNQAAAKFLYKMGWTKIALISSSDPSNVLLNERFIDFIDQLNISLLYYGLVEFRTTDAAKIKVAFDEMVAKVTPRIIFIHNYDGISYTCFLHRYGLYGPGYVIFMYNWNYFDVRDPIPWYVQPWCTVDMLLEVIPSVISYGDGELADIYGSTFRDQMGITQQEMLQEFENRIENPRSNSIFTYMAPTFYDRYIALGIALNETEKRLRAINLTLADLTTDKPLWQTNGSNVVQLLKSGLFSINVRGFKGIYSYDPNDNWNNSSAPITFFQLTIDNGKIKSELIGYCLAEVTLLSENFRWRTKGNSIPKDSIVVLDAVHPIIPITANIAVKVLTSLACLFSSAIIFWGFKDKNHLKLDLLCFVGTFASAVHVFIVPINESKHLGNFCSVIVVLLSLSLSCLSCYLLISLQKSLRMKPLYAYSSLIWCWVNFALIVGALSMAPLSASLKKREMIPSEEDESLAYQQWHQACDWQEKMMETSNSAFILVAIAGISQCFIFILVGFFAFKVQSLAKATHSRMERRKMKLLSICVYSFLLTTFAGCVIGILKARDTAALLILVQILNIALSMIVTSFLIIPRMFASTPLVAAGRPTAGSKLPSSLNNASGSKTSNAVL